MLVASLSSAQMAGLALMGAAFIVFALVSSFVLPRKWPNFPGKYLWAYVAVVGCFFVGMMATVVFVAKESSEAKAESPPPAQPSPAPAPSPPPSPSPAPPPPAAGNAAAGKAVFAANGCAACHTYTPAAATGNVGPDLDHLATDAQKANRGTLVQYTNESIIDPNAYVVPGFAANVMPPNFGTTIKKADSVNLVAFLTKPS